MKFTLVSDLHLEFSPYTLPGDKDSILLLAGDICTAKFFRNDIALQSPGKRTRFEDFFRHVSENYKDVYYIVGNHEYYGDAWENTQFRLCAALEGTGIHLLDKDWINLGDNTVLYGATLWTDFEHGNPITMEYVRNYMADYTAIKHFDRRLAPVTLLEDHNVALNDLKIGLNLYKDKKIVVMTHHAPTYLSVDPKYGGHENPANAGFASDLDHVILDNPAIKAWVHGHMHGSFDYTIDPCRVLCNPRGYDYNGGHEENPDFNNSLSFEV